MDNFDLNRTNDISEIIEINKDLDYFKSNNLTSVAGLYIIGVSGKKNSTF